MRTWTDRAREREMQFPHRRSDLSRDRPARESRGRVNVGGSHSVPTKRRMSPLVEIQTFRSRERNISHRATTPQLRKFHTPGGQARPTPEKRRPAHSKRLPKWADGRSATCRWAQY